MSETYSFWNCLYRYNLDCVLIDGKTQEKITEFQAREYAEQTRGAGYVGGGIGSTSQNYVIATANDLAGQAEPIQTIVIVEGVKFRIASKKINILTPVWGYKHLPKKKEYILFLE